MKKECDNHLRARSLANIVLTIGYYWPTMRGDSVPYVKRWDKCQGFVPIPYQPPKCLIPILALWTFMKWGVDIFWKLPTTLGQQVYMLVVTNCFTKWIEAEAFH